MIGLLVGAGLLGVGYIVLTWVCFCCVYMVLWVCLLCWFVINAIVVVVTVVGLPFASVFCLMGFPVVCFGGICLLLTFRLVG